MGCIFFGENIATFHQDEITHTDVGSSIWEIYILEINTSIVKYTVEMQVSLFCML